MESRFDKLLQSLRSKSHEERMELVDRLLEGWKQYKRKQHEGSR